MENHQKWSRNYDHERANHSTLRVDGRYSTSNDYDKNSRHLSPDGKKGAPCANVLQSNFLTLPNLDDLNKKEYLASIENSVHSPSFFPPNESSTYDTILMYSTLPKSSNSNEFSGNTTSIMGRSDFVFGMTHVDNTSAIPETPDKNIPEGSLLSDKDRQQSFSSQMLERNLHQGYTDLGHRQALISGTSKIPKETSFLPLKVGQPTELKNHNEMTKNILTDMEFSNVIDHNDYDFFSRKNKTYEHNGNDHLFSDDGMKSTNDFEQNHNTYSSPLVRELFPNNSADTFINAGDSCSVESTSSRTSCNGEHTVESNTKENSTSVYDRGIQKTRFSHLKSESNTCFSTHNGLDERNSVLKRQQKKYESVTTSPNLMAKHRKSKSLDEGSYSTYDATNNQLLVHKNSFKFINALELEIDPEKKLESMMSRKDSSSAKPNSFSKFKPKEGKRQSQQDHNLIQPLSQWHFHQRNPFHQRLQHERDNASLHETQLHVRSQSNSEFSPYSKMNVCIDAGISVPEQGCSFNGPTYNTRLIDGPTQFSQQGYGNNSNGHTNQSHLAPAQQRRYNNGVQSVVPSIERNTAVVGISSAAPLHATSSSHNFANAPQQSRTAPDVLKTLLRKKACLYESDTSRAIALITWLVGRRMALKFGYFSRQQLQSGVHHVVSPKIDAGIITRTKVNRCMQIILNSCFHYIIPRPDGEEEKGDAFRRQFAKSVKISEDDNLLQALPVPWNDLSVDEALEEWLDVLEEEVNDSRETGGRRVVLLCFNENVRSSDDVFRCHNEFIRDAANSANLVLTADEWKAFFAGGSNLSHVDNVDFYGVTSSSPSIKSSLPDNTFGVTHDTFRASQFFLSPSAPLNTPPPSPNNIHRNGSQMNLSFIESTKNEILGRMSVFELGQFRTTWCSKRYDHDSLRCGFAHVDVNRGWLRRNPSMYKYSDELCPHIVAVDSESFPDGCYFNSCPKGIMCQFAHSQEEVDYHPNRYKSIHCPYASNINSDECHLKDVCPYIHEANKNMNTKPTKKMISMGKKKVISPNTSTKINDSDGPHGAPMMYVKMAPTSDFDRSLMLPGLQCLFRHRSNTTFSIFNGCATCAYRNF